MRKNINDGKNANQELTNKQKLDLKAINHRIDKKVKNTIRNGKGIKIREDLIEAQKHFYKRMYGDTNERVKIYFIIVTVLTMLLLIKAVYYRTNNNSLNDIKYAKTVITLDNIGDNKELLVKPNELAIKADNDKYVGIDYVNWISLNLDTNSTEYKIADTEYNISNNTELSSLLINNKIIYEEYRNIEGTGSKELYFGSNKPNVIDTKGFKKLTSRIYEKSSPLRITDYMYSYYNTFIYLQETLGGGELTITTLKSKMNNIESYIKSSEQYYGTVLAINGFKELNISNLDKLAAIKYDNNSKVVTVYNENDNMDYFYLSGVNNEVVKCNSEDLLNTNNNQIYLTYGFTDKDSDDYLSFCIKIEDNLYIMKINQDYRDEVLNWFKNETCIDITELKIDKVQTVIYKEE